MVKFLQHNIVRHAKENQCYGLVWIYTHSTCLTNQPWVQHGLVSLPSPLLFLHLLFTIQNIKYKNEWYQSWIFTLNFPQLLLVFQKWLGDMGLFCSIPWSMEWITLPIGDRDGVKCRLLPAFSIFTGCVYCASIPDWNNCCFAGAIIVQRSSFYYVIMAFLPIAKSFVPNRCVHLVVWALLLCLSPVLGAMKATEENTI